jgi:hypothetical protein
MAIVSKSFSKYMDNNYVKILTYWEGKSMSKACVYCTSHKILPIPLKFVQSTCHQGNLTIPRNGGILGKQFSSLLLASSALSYVSEVTFAKHMSISNTVAIFGNEPSE